MNITFGKSGYIPFRSTRSLGQAYKPLNKATIIRNKLCKSIYGRTPPYRDEANEAMLNTIMLSPYCLIDIAYGIWQSAINGVEFNDKLKEVVDSIRLRWSNNIYSEKGFYSWLNQNDIYELSEYSDKLSRHIDKDIKCLYNNIYSSLGFMQNKHRELCTNLWVVANLLNITKEKFYKDWHINYAPFNILIEDIGKLESAYINHYYGEKEITFRSTLTKVIKGIDEKLNKIKYES